MLTTVVNDDLLNIPMLEPDGGNWVIFKTRLEWALASKNVDSHLLGKKPKPKAAADGADPDVVKAAADELEQWEKSQNLARHMLGQRLRDSTLRKIIRKPSVAEMWLVISTEFEKKSALVQANL
jgi:hypothetical protein